MTKIRSELTAWLLTKIVFYGFLFPGLFRYLLYGILIMNQSDNCHSQATWSVTVQRT